LTRRTISLDVKFPALMTGLALLTGAVFVWLGQRELTRVLQQNAGARLGQGGAVIASMLAQGIAPGVERLRRIAVAPDMRAAAAAQAADSQRLGLRYLDADGAVHDLVPPRDGEGPVWSLAGIRDGSIAANKSTLAPFRAFENAAIADVVFPVIAPGDSAPRGWLIDSHRLRGTGIQTVRDLAGSATLIIGQPDAGVWTDLQTVVPGAPAGIRAGETSVFDDSPRGAGVGYATPIPGTPWVVWMQREKESVLAPLKDFRLRVAPVALVLIFVTFGIVWTVSHRVTHRVVKLTERVDEMAAKEPAVADADLAPIEGEDEIERLERSFDALFERTRHERELEEQLQQAQRLEAVGRLAGGVAHDFNNVLTVITNYSEMLRADADEGSQQATDLDQVLRAADRATRLTRQLLAFSRRQILQPERLDLNDVVRDAHAMLRRLIPTHITIEMDLADGLAPIIADSVQVEQVLVNLAVNASDAMPDGGHLLFRTTTSELDAEDATPGQTAKRYACLMVRDDGTGMDRATVARIFEPFYTTKPQGKGTGLGLATVHGIVTQLGGRIWVYSEPGAGTTFKVFLPFADKRQFAERRKTPRSSLKAVAAGDVLLVEDDEATRGVVERILVENGFTVRLAHDGASALLNLLSGPLPDLVVSDLMMPGVDGAELSLHIHERWPQLPVVIMSGYADVEHGSGAIIGAVVLEKPFTARALLEALSRALATVAARST